jgi:hypothetical protein
MRQTVTSFVETPSTWHFEHVKKQPELPLSRHRDGVIMPDKLVGALTGWKSRATGQGVALTIEVAPSAQSFRAKEVSACTAVLNDQQLHALIHDLIEIAGARGVDVGYRRRVKLW